VTRIYTRTGDRGDTGLFGGGRVPKAHPRVEAYGSLDEFNSVLGWALTQIEDAEVRDGLAAVQHELFTIGAHLATPPDAPAERKAELPPLPRGRDRDFEAWMDRADAELPELHAFILPGGTPGGAALHLARTVCRRAERRIAALAAHEPVAPEILVYLNRLGDLLFVLARLVNHRAGSPEAVWRHS